MTRRCCCVAVLAVELHGPQRQHGEAGGPAGRSRASARDPAHRLLAGHPPRGRGGPRHGPGRGVVQHRAHRGNPPDPG
eukprot:scaffold24740_cov29-Prasinocladus_malaysianus.AAC.1